MGQIQKKKRKHLTWYQKQFLKDVQRRLDGFWEPCLDYKDLSFGILDTPKGYILYSSTMEQTYGSLIELFTTFTIDSVPLIDLIDEIELSSD